jgi:hypothetical protein
VSSAIDSTNLRSISWSASSGMVQSPRPSGGSLQAKAIRVASPLAVRFLSPPGRGDLGLSLQTQEALGEWE